MKACISSAFGQGLALQFHRDHVDRPGRIAGPRASTDLPSRVKRDRELHRLAEIHRIDVQLDLDAVRVVVARLVQHHVPAGHHEEAAPSPLEEEAGRVGQWCFSPEHRRRRGSRRAAAIRSAQRRRSSVNGKFGLRSSARTFDRAPACGRCGRSARGAGLGLVGVDREGRRSCGRRDARRGTGSRRASGPSRCRRGRRPAARARRWSDAAPTAAARRGSARRRRTRRRCRSAAAARARPLQVSTWRSPTRPVALHLQALDRGIDVARGAAGARLPRPARARARARVRSSTLDAARGELADARKAELEMRREPLELAADSRRRAAPSTRRSKSCQTKCGSMKRSCSSVPQRTSRAGR